jgi:hypothetical protein
LISLRAKQSIGRKNQAAPFHQGEPPFNLRTVRRDRNAYVSFFCLHVFNHLADILVCIKRNDSGFGVCLLKDAKYFVRSPAECTGAIKTPVSGEPDQRHISTSYAERNNLNVRMHSRRMTRLTNAFSKKMENHAHAMALHFLYYNFVRIHKTLKVTPAMAAGVTDRLWEVADMADILEAWETQRR